MHIVRYADDFKLFCETREDAQALLNEVAEWLKSKLGLETSPEKSGITNLRRNYTCFLGIEIKYKSRAERLPPDYKGRKRKWVTTSRIKRKALGKIEGKLDREMMSLKSAGTADTAKAVEKYNSVVDGIVNYFSMASQVSRDLNGVQKNLKMRMHNQLDGITGEVPEGYRPGSATDKRQSRSKSALYLKGHLVHSLGYCKFRCPKRLVKDMCDYTTVGRSIQGIKTGVPPPILALLGRHPPPGMLVEVADNRVSSYSSQKGLCAILDVPIPPGGFDTVLKIPSKTRDKYRFGNIALLSPLASQVISAPKWEDVEKLLQGYSLSNEQLAKIQKYRQWRKLPIN